jgi:hypothetical protein
MVTVLRVRSPPSFNTAMPKPPVEQLVKLIAVSVSFAADTASWKMRRPLGAASQLSTTLWPVPSTITWF